MKGAPGSLLGGRLGVVAPPASFNVQEVPRDKGCAATPLRVRVMGGGDGFGGGGGEGGGKDGFCGGWFCSFVFLVWFLLAFTSKKKHLCFFTA